MKKFMITIMAIMMLSIASTASAMMTISNVCITDSSITFTIDGDMTGYKGTPLDVDRFSIEYCGEIFNSNFGYSGNSWNASIFDNESVSLVGNTGNWYGLNYTWVDYETSLSDAVATDNIVTLTMGRNYLDLTENGTINFLWGGANSSHIELGSFDYNGNNAVPVPPTILLLGSGFIGMMAVGRRKFFNN